MRLSDTAITRLMQTKQDGYQFIKDDLSTSLNVRIGKNKASWYFIGTVDNTRIRLAIGKYPKINTDKARELAHAIMINGKPVIDAIPAEPAIIPTFGQVMALYAQHRKLSARSTTDYTGLINKFSYSDKPITLDQDQFIRHYQQIHQSTPTQARYLARVIKALQRWASEYYSLNIPDATAKISNVIGESITKANARDRRLEEHQLNAFKDVLGAFGDGLQVDAVTFALLTGLRHNELRQITANSILHRGDVSLLVIENTKNGIPQNLPLVGIASAIIQRRINATTGNAPLFATDARGLFKKLAGQGVSLSWHDLRRSWASFAVKAGVSESVIKRTLNHSDKANVTSKHYLRIDLETLANALLAVENVIFK